MTVYFVPERCTHEYGLGHIDPTQLVNNLTTNKIHWSELDDCHSGYNENQINWNNCFHRNRVELIKEYNLVMGYQPKPLKPPKRPDSKWWEYDRFPDNVDKIISWARWLGGILGIIILNLTLYSNLEIPLSIVVSILSLFPLYFLNTVIGLIVVYGTAYICERLHNKKKAKQNAKEELNNWIKGCRK